MGFTSVEDFDLSEGYVPNEGPNHKRFIGKIPKKGCQICGTLNITPTGVCRRFTDGESPVSFISWKCKNDNCGFIWGEIFKYMAWATNDVNSQIVG